MKKYILLFILYLLNIAVSHAQKSLPDTILAISLNEKITLDGKLEESIWQNSNKISNFTQTEPDLGKPATEKTQVAIVYSSSFLYIGIWCYQSTGTKISAKSLQRDFDYDSEDNFRIAISPFNDGQRGYEFVVNPNGARNDMLVSAWDDANSDWNGVWDAAATITNEGWFAEIEIPYNTLKFKNSEKQIWAINFERNIKNRNETDRWQGWSRDFNIENFSVAGTLSGLRNISYTQKFEFKPYILGGWELKDDKISYSTNGKIGGDLNYNITPTLKLNLTANTDFAQVESDLIQVNLSRFNLYYPEKREFFLEGASNFDFYIGNNNNVFYSRRIGIENFQSVNIMGGARLFGKVGKSNIGFLSLQTAATDTIPTINNSLFRYKYDLGEQSYIGGIVTSKINNRHQNIVAGLDGTYTTAHFLKNKNLVIGALITVSSDEGKIKNNSFSYRIYSDYPNDLIDHYISVSSVQQNFNPELGFLSRDNYNAFNWHLYISPRWFNKYKVRKVIFCPGDISLFWTQSTGQLESFSNTSIPFGLQFQSGDEFYFNLSQSYDRIDEPFDLTNNISVETGKYNMHTNGIQVNTFRGRKLFAELLYNGGTIYNGKINTFSATLGININKHLNFNEQYKLNILNKNSIKDQIQLFISTLSYAFTTKIDISILAQYNSEDDQLLANIRVHWIPKIGTDFYFVVNNGYAPVKQADYLNPSINSGAAKLVWRFTF